MKKVYLMLPMTLALIAQAQANDDNSTIVRSPHGTAIITQSGDPAAASTKIEREPGRTIITRKSGGNSTTVIQGGTAGDLPADISPEMRRLLKMLGQ